MHPYWSDPMMHPIWNVPGGTRSISTCVAVSRTRHGRPVAMIAARSAGSVTTAGSGCASTSVAHDGTVTGHSPHATRT